MRCDTYRSLQTPRPPAPSILVPGSHTRSVCPVPLCLLTRSSSGSLLTPTVCSVRTRSRSVCLPSICSGGGGIMQGIPAAHTRAMPCVLCAFGIVSHSILDCVCEGRRTYAGEERQHGDTPICIGRRDAGTAYTSSLRLFPCPLRRGRRRIRIRRTRLLGRLLHNSVPLSFLRHCARASSCVSCCFIAGLLLR